MTERVRHVWIRPEHSPTERPGLVLEWRCVSSVDVDEVVAAATDLASYDAATVAA